MHAELEVLAPHGVEGVAVDGFGAEVAAVDGHAQDVHLDTGAAGGVAGTHVLTGDDLEEHRPGVMSTRGTRCEHPEAGNATLALNQLNFSRFDEATTVCVNIWQTLFHIHNNTHTGAPVL